MKNFLKKISTLILLGFITILSIFGNGGTTVQEDTAEVNLAHRLLNEIKATDRFIRNIDSLYAIDLPVGIASKDDKNAEDYAIAISDIILRNGKTYMNAYMAFTIPGTTKKIAFKGTDIPLSFSGGLKGPASLYLVSDFAVDLTPNTTLILRGSGKTSVTCDCNGFKEMHVVADIIFDSTLFVPENPDGSTRNEAIRTSFETTITDWNDLMVGVSIEPFQLKPLKGVGFSVTNAVFDLSDFKNPANIQFTEKHTTDYFIDGNPNIWQGLYIQEAQVRMPPQFRKKTNKELSADSAAAQKSGINPSDTSFSDTTFNGRLTFYAKNLLIDELGFTARLGVSDLVLLDEGDMSGWDFSVNKLEIDIQANQLVAAGFSGQVRVPLLKEDNVLNYNANIGLNGTYAFSCGITDTLNLPLWKADLMLEPNSTLGITATDKVFVPYLLLNGELSIKAPTDKEDTTSPKLALAKLTFQGMRLQTSKPYFSVEQISFGTEQNRFSKFPVSITEVGITNAEDRTGLTIGMSVNFTGETDGAFGGDGVFTVWGKHENKKWKFDGVDVGLLSVDISKPNAFSLYGSVLFIKGDKIYGNGFKGELKADFAGFGMQASALFGNVNDYRYWYADALVAIPEGIPVGPVAVYGFGGGAFYHIKQNMSDTVKSEIGRTLSGIKYTPNKTIGLGLKASVKFGLAESENTFNGDAEFSISFHTTGGIEQIGFMGNAYFATDNFSVNTSGIMEKAKYIMEHTSGEIQIPKETESSQLYGNVSILYEFQNKSFHATFDIYANIAGGIIKGVGPGGKAGWGIIHFDPDNWYIYLGTPDNPNGINVMNLAKITNYFMAGKDLPGMPLPPSEVINELSDHGKAYPTERSSLDLASGKGFAFGGNFTFDTGDRTWLMFYGRFGCVLGFDILMKNYGNRSCEGRSGPIGVNGWYAQGQAYAWVAAKVGVGVDLPFFSGKYEIFNMSVAALMQAKAPNPFWMKGNVAGQYHLLNGKINGYCDFEFEIGEQCKLVAANPLGGMSIISEIKPMKDEADVNVFTTPQVLFNIPVGEPIEIKDEKNVEHTYKVKLDQFKIGTSAGQPILGSTTWNDRNDVLVFKSKEILPGETTIQVHAQVTFEEYKNGNWYTVTKDGAVSKETKEISFTTGKEPDYIPQNNVAYSYPGYRAFNYYKTEATTNYIKMDMAQYKLFEPGDEWNQKARIKPVSGGTATYFDFTYDKENNQINLSIPTSIANNTIYKLELVNVPVTTAANSDANVEQQSETQTVEAEGYSTDVEVITQTAEESRAELQEKVIYGMEFRTSNYNTFTEKMNGLVYSDGITWELYPLVHSLTVNITGERFDDHEIVNLTEGTMIKCVPVLSETAWYNNYIGKLINLSTANLNAIRVKPFETPALTSYLFQSGGTRRLTEEEVNSGSTSDIVVISGMKDYIAKYTCEYLYLLKGAVANAYPSGKIPAGQLENLYNASFIPLLPGNYPINVNYTLPGQTNPNRELKYIIKLND